MLNVLSTIPAPCSPSIVTETKKAHKPGVRSSCCAMHWLSSLHASIACYMHYQAALVYVYESKKKFFKLAIWPDVDM